jgi:GMP synthase-like glutamine amidotransferase
VRFPDAGTTEVIAVLRTAPVVCVLVLSILALPAWCGKIGFTSGVLAGVNGLFDDPADAAPGTAPAICVLCTKHPDTLREALASPTGVNRSRLDYYRKLEADCARLGGVRALTLHYAQLPDGFDFAHTSFKALVVTALDRSISDESRAQLLRLLHGVNLPMIGFCGGHQLIVEAYGGTVGYMRPLRAGEVDPNPGYTPGYFKEWGFMPVRITRRDSLFEGLGDEIVVRELHAWEVKRLPPEFEVLAATDACQIQAVRHRTRPIWGTQFHPERFDAAHPAGELILRNFLRAAGLTPTP